MAKRTTDRSAAEDSGAPATAQPKPRRSKASAPQPSADDRLESVSMASEPSEEDIRLRAYHRYLERGGGHGMDFEDWLEAERELKQR
jgi:hypothetical protein